MVGTRSKALKQGPKGKRREIEDPPGEQENSSTLSWGENSVDHPLVVI